MQPVHSGSLRRTGERGSHDQASRARRSFRVDERRTCTDRSARRHHRAGRSRAIRREVEVKTVGASALPPHSSTMPWYEKERPSSGGEYMRHQLQAWSGCAQRQNCAHRGRAMRLGRAAGWAGAAALPPVRIALGCGWALRFGRASSAAGAVLKLFGPLPPMSRLSSRASRPCCSQEAAQEAVHRRACWPRQRMPAAVF